MSTGAINMPGILLWVVLARARLSHAVPFWRGMAPQQSSRLLPG